jgi:hypothetical protein
MARGFRSARLDAASCSLQLDARVALMSASLAAGPAIDEARARLVKAAGLHCTHPYDLRYESALAEAVALLRLSTARWVRDQSPVAQAA